MNQQAKLARRLSAKVMGIISPRSEKTKKEAELALPEEETLEAIKKSEESAPTVNTEIPGGDLSSPEPIKVEESSETSHVSPTTTPPVPVVSASA